MIRDGQFNIRALVNYSYILRVEHKITYLQGFVGQSRQIMRSNVFTKGVSAPKRCFVYFGTKCLYFLQRPIFLKQRYKVSKIWYLIGMIITRMLNFFSRTLAPDPDSLQNPSGLTLINFLRHYKQRAKIS